MNRSLIVSAFILTLAMPLAANGAGGIEFGQVIGRDLWPLPGGSGLPPTTGLISSFAGLGYGVDHEGSVLGGFGMGISSDSLSMEGTPLGRTLNGFHAGYGGTIQGWQHNWGPLVGLFTTRIGFGGADWTSGSNHTGGFSLLGTAGAQFGVTIFPWFLIGVEVGGAGTMTFISGQPFLIGYAPTLGVRLLWGSFK